MTACGLQKSFFLWKIKKKEIAILFPSEMAHLEPFEVVNKKIRCLDLLGWYKICWDLE